MFFSISLCPLSKIIGSKRKLTGADFHRFGWRPRKKLGSPKATILLSVNKPRTHLLANSNSTCVLNNRKRLIFYKLSLVVS